MAQRSASEATSAISTRVKRSVPDRKDQARRAALNALRKARRAAARAGVELSAWEDEFISSVSDRVQTYGRAFGDPEKGDHNAPLSVLQAVKLKEIAAKTKREKGKKAREAEPEQ
jgi:N-acyl-D-aspartate/D-glutamate deacylase